MSRESEMAKAAIATETARNARAAREATPAPVARTVNVDLRDYPPGLIAVPTTDFFYTEAATALMQLRGVTPPGTELRLMSQTASSISTKRTLLVEYLLARPHLQWLFFLDSDMTPPAHAIAQLLQHKLDIVAGVYCLRQPPYPACVSWFDGVQPRPEELGRPISVARTGLGCMLISRKVLEHLRAPWFAENPETPGLGEDFYFCNRARSAGFTVHLDTQLEVGHLGVTSITPSFSAIYAQTPDGQKAYTMAQALGELTRTTPAAPLTPSLATR